MQFYAPIREKAKSGLPAGYTARMATIDDVSQAIDMLNTAEMADLGEPIGTEEALRVEWTMPDFSPEKDIHLVFAPGGDLAGYVEVWCGDPYARAFLFGRAHPDHRGQGIGSYLMRWGERRARQHIHQAPPGARFTVRTMTEANNTQARRLFTVHGFDLVRHFYRMVTEMAPDEAPPAPAWPAGLSVRTFVRGQDERPVYDAMNDAFRDHWGFIQGDEFDEWAHWFTHNPQFDPSLNFLAVTADGEIAGMALCSPELDGRPDLGWVGTLGVRRPWRRQGLATALLYHAFGAFHRRGQHKVGLGVDAESLTGALRLYQKVGMHVARQNDAYEKVLRAGHDLSTQSISAEG